MTTKTPFSIFKGYTFSFEDDGNRIEAWFSSFSGLEKVFVNCRLASTQRSYARYSANQFKIGSNEYSTQLDAKSLLKGPFVCTLLKNGKVYKRQRLEFPGAASANRKVPLVLQLFFYVLLGVVFGAFKAFFDLPNSATIGFLIVVFAAILAYEFRSRKNKNLKPVIVDENIG